MIANLEEIAEIFKEYHAYLDLDEKFSVGEKQYSFLSFTNFIMDHSEKTPEYEKNINQIRDYFSSKCYSNTFPKRIIMSKTLSLMCGDETEFESKKIFIPDPILECGLTLHELQFLEEAVYLENGHVLDESYSIDKTTYLTANIGFIVSKIIPSMKEESDSSSESKKETKISSLEFITFPINDERYLTYATEQKDASNNKKPPHAEINLYNYIKQDENFKNMIVQELKSRLIINTGIEIKVHAIILDFHSTNCMCGSCQISTLEEQRYDKAGNVYSRIVGCLNEAHISLKSPCIPMITRVSALTGKHFLLLDEAGKKNQESKDHDEIKESKKYNSDEYENYIKDIQHLCAPVKPISKNEDKEVFRFNGFILHQTIEKAEEKLKNVVEKYNNSRSGDKDKSIRSLHNTFFSNGWEHVLRDKGLKRLRDQSFFSQESSTGSNRSGSRNEAGEPASKKPKLS